MGAADLAEPTSAAVEVIHRGRTTDRTRRRIRVRVGVIVRAPLPLLNLRIFLPQDESSVRALEGALQLRHLRRTVGDFIDTYGPAAVPPQFEGDARIVVNDGARMQLLGAHLENAVLEVAVVDGAVVKQPEVRTRGF